MSLSIRALKKLLLSISLLSISVSALMILPVSAQAYGPHLNKVSFMYVPEGQRVAWMTLLSGLDECPDLYSLWDAYPLADAGKKILSTVGGHLACFVFNLRNYTTANPPYWGAGYPASYAKRFLLDPWFRLAIAYLTPKSMLIRQIFSWLAIRVDAVVPPQLATYYNDAVPRYEYDPDLAVQTLLDHGYIRVGSPPNWYWAYSDGTPLADAYFLSPDQREASGLYRMVMQTVAEMGKIGLANIRQKPVSFSTLCRDYLYPNAFDMTFLSWKGLGPDPDHLWAFFNSANDVYQGRNHNGLRDAQIDALTDVIHTSLDDYGEVVPAAMQVQALLADPTKPYGLCQIPIYSRVYCLDAYQPDLEGIVRMPLVGSDNYWTYLNIRWKPGTGHGGDPADNSFTGPLFSEIFNLNPLIASWADEVEILPFGTYQEEILSRVFDRLMNKDPYTLDDIYWLATYRDISAFTGTTDFGYVDGMRLKYTIREGLKWQDGEDFTADDIKFALDYMAWAQPGLWTTAWEYYVGTRIISPTEVEIYYNQTSLWLKDTVETVACMLPPQVWNDANGDGVQGDPVVDWQHFNLWTMDHTGHAIPGTTLTMKKLFGMGAWYFYHYDPASMLAELYPNPNYQKSQAEIEFELADAFYWFGDVNKDGRTDIFDFLKASFGWGAQYPDPRYMIYKDADIVPARNPDLIIDIEDIVQVGHAFGRKMWY